MSRRDEKSFLEAFSALCRHASKMSAGELQQDPECLSLAHVLMGGHGAGQSESRRGGRVGRKQVHDRNWAESCLINMAIDDPDGLPERQSVMVDRLRSCFEKWERPVPGDTWLKREVGGFYRRAVEIDTDVRERFRQSTDLQVAFETEANYLSACKARDLFERQWHNNKEIQRQFRDPLDYASHRMGWKSLPTNRG